MNLSVLSSRVLSAMASHKNMSGRTYQEMTLLVQNAIVLEGLLPDLVAMSINGHADVALAMLDDLQKGRYEEAKDRLAVYNQQQKPVFEVHPQDSTVIGVTVNGTWDVCIEALDPGVEIRVWSAPWGDLHLGTLKIDGSDI